MEAIKFEWNQKKNEDNIRKHKISFGEAKTVFWDEKAAIAHDPDHSENEDRYIIIGFSANGQLLLICFCERDGGNIIRIISARKLTRREMKQFNERWKRWEKSMI